MNPYDDLTARAARPSSGWDENYPGGHDRSGSPSRAGRASVGRASVAVPPPGAGTAGNFPTSGSPPPVSPAVPGGRAVGRAVVGRASVRPVSPGIGPSGRGGPAGRGPSGPGGPGAGAGGPRGPVSPAERATQARRRNIAIAAFAVFIMLTGIGVVSGTYFVDSVPTPGQLPLPQSTTVYYSDGATVMARLGEENRTLLTFDEMNDAVKDAIVAAEDKTFWTNEGVDFGGVIRAAWNNFTGGERQGGSTIAQQYARVAMNLQGATYSRKIKEAVMAWKLSDTYDKKQILEFYLNTVPFGRGAYGIEAAAQAYYGKSARKASKNQVTLSEAAVLVGMVKQPEPDPADPVGSPGYDPLRFDPKVKNEEAKAKALAANAKALENSQDRWRYVLNGLLEMGKLSEADAAALEYPMVKEYKPNSAKLDEPTGLVVRHALAELAQVDAFKEAAVRQGGPDANVWDFIRNGGFKIVTTVDKAAQAAAVRAADLTNNPKAPQRLQKQAKNWRAALVAVDPDTGGVFAYFGGEDGAGSDYAGWYIDEEGDPNGFGYHPPGSTFKVYDLLTALKNNWSLDSYWDSPPYEKAFPEAGRKQSNPVHNASTTSCTPICSLSRATVLSLNIPFFDITWRLGPANVLATARDAGIDDMWEPGGRRRLADADTATLFPQYFGPELGIGQYAITVLDHANGMATVANGGHRRQAHFVKKVLDRKGDPVYGERIIDKPIGVPEGKINELHQTLRQVETSNFGTGWDAGSKTGTWEWKSDAPNKNAHVWVVGYTKKLATAVWVGTEDGKPLRDKSGSWSVYGSSHAGPIWQQFMREVHKAKDWKPYSPKNRFGPPGPPGNLFPPGAVESPKPDRGRDGGPGFPWDPPFPEPTEPTEPGREPGLTLPPPPG